MATAAEITQDNLQDLVAMALAFDELATSVRQLAGLAENDNRTIDEQVCQLMTSALSGDLGGLITNKDKFQSDLAKLTERAKEVSATDSHARLDKARLLARHILDTHQDKPDQFKGYALCTALNAFTASPRMRASAIDILASAILMTKERFTAACYGANHDPVSLASELGVPAGAAALRQRILFPHKFPQNR